MKITSASIVCADWSTTVHITLEDGSSRPLFDYFRDEIWFTASEFVGKTIPQAMQLKSDRDRAYMGVR